MKSHQSGAAEFRAVFKYALPLTNSPSEAVPIRLPAGARILKVAEQGVDPVLGPKVFVWALVDPDESLQELRYVVTAGTGHKIALDTLANRDWDYQDSLLCLGGRLVVHVWISTPEGKGGSEVSTEN